MTRYEEMDHRETDCGAQNVSNEDGQFDSSDVGTLLNPEAWRNLLRLLFFALFNVLHSQP